MRIFKLLFISIIILGAAAGIIFFRSSIYSRIAEKSASFVEEVKTLLNAQIQPKEAGEYQKMREAYKPLNLEIIATLVDKKESNKSMAYIKDLETGYEAGYRIKSRIRDAVISEIEFDKVTFLRKNGKKEILKVKYNDYPKYELSEIIIKENGKVSVDRLKLISNYSNLNALLKEVILEPFLYRGRVEGVKIRHIENNSIILTAGLMENDIIKKVNNRSIISAEDAIDVYNNLKPNPNNIHKKFDLTLTVEREGKPQTLSYNIIN